MSQLETRQEAFADRYLLFRGSIYPRLDPRTRSSIVPATQVWEGSTHVNAASDPQGCLSHDMMKEIRTTLKRAIEPYKPEYRSTVKTHSMNAVPIF